MSTNNFSRYLEDYLKAPKEIFIPGLIQDIKNILENILISTEAINIELDEFGENSVESIGEMNALIGLSIQNIFDILDAASEYNKLNNL